MNAYDLIRSANITMSIIVAGLFVYIDRHAFRLFGLQLLSGGELIGRVARVLFMLATAYGSLVAVILQKPAGNYVIGLLVSILLLTIGSTWQAFDSWHASRSYHAETMNEKESDKRDQS